MCKSTSVNDAMAVPYAATGAVMSLLLSNRKPAIDACHLHSHPPMDVAEELTLMDAEMLRKISADELRNGAWMDKAKKHELAPNVMAMVGAFNRVALLVPTEILQETTPQARAKVISVFIQVASKCYQLHNYDSLKAVLAGLQCTPIYRLKKTWKEVPSKRRKRFRQLSELMSEEDNWEVYRKDLEQQFTSSTPCIMFLGVFLTQIVQQDSYNQCKAKTGCGIRRHSSVLGNYTVLEAITVRNQFEKLTRSHSGRKHGGQYIPCIASREGCCKENDRTEFDSEDSGYNETSSSCVHNQSQESQRSLQSLTPAATSSIAPSATTQAVRPDEQHKEGDRQQVSLQNSEGVPSHSVPPQLSQNTVVPISPRGTNRAKPCRLIRERSMSDPALDAVELRTKFNNDFADGIHIRSQSLESLQDSDADLSRSCSSSADTLDSLSSDEEQIPWPALKLPPSFNSTMSLPAKSPLPLASPIGDRKRRATTDVLRLRLAKMNCSSSPSDLLQKYQFFSLGCCRGVESRAELRALLTDTSHNTEGQNYKLSCQREP